MINFKGPVSNKVDLLLPEPEPNITLILTMLRKLIFILPLLFLHQTILSAQQLAQEQGSILIQLPTNTNIKSFVHHWSFFKGKPTELQIKSPLIPALNIWKISFDHIHINEHHFLKAIRGNSKCLAAQFNHFVSSRQNLPNDGLFSNQWHHINIGNNGGVPDADMDTDLAWDISTGGLTLSGDTIVVAVLDDGVQIDHPDLAQNLWRNHGEIPNNGIDDDNNGYVDDFIGWNISSNTDQIAGGGHGTPVAGIIGAIGNNNIGISGVNWNVKIMIVKNDFNTTESEVLEAYAYPLKMRIKFNESDGLEGAFVVATNASWGINGGNPDDAPLWCGLFDELGEVGILNCGATANSNLNVDEEGDLPTGCTSDYLISVTNMRRNDTKEPEAAYGANSVDLGAFGSEVFTLGNNNNYTTFGGTSGATPQVTAAVALLYSAPCPDIVALYENDPAAAALLIKEYILGGVDPNISLDNITTTEGRMNIHNSMQLVIENCSPCLPPYNLTVENVDSNSINLIWNAPLDEENNILSWRLVGSNSWNTSTDAVSPFLVSGLIGCTNYEFQIESVCSNMTSSSSVAFPFQTDGCCIAPEEILISDIGLSGCQINFPTVTTATQYNILVTNQNTATTEEIQTIETSFFLNLLESCNPYLVQVNTVCANGQTTEYNNGATFTTFGCGACTDLSYCPSAAETSEFEWISNVSFNSLNNDSGNDNGYGDYSGLFTEVATYSSYPISISPTFAGPSYNEYIKVWIDYNQDGDFEEENELVFDPLSTTSATITAEVIIPSDALPGLTRMRVSMKYIGDFDMEEPEYCTSLFGFGEVEDYCLLIVEGPPPNCDLPFNLDTLSSSFANVTLNWEDPTEDHENHNLRYRKSGTFNWTQINGIDPPFELSNLELCTNYESQVSANCVGMGTSGFTNIFVFSTDCIINSQNLLSTAIKIGLYPNPADQFLVVDFEIPIASNIKLSLISVDGKQQLLQDGYFAEAGEHQLVLDELSQFPAGLYWLVFETEEDSVFEKIVLVR
ncbi:MAG: serine protease [Polaribacter sp.]